jgi:hypothetical protein
MEIDIFRLLSHIQQRDVAGNEFLELLVTIYPQTKWAEMQWNTQFLQKSKKFNLLVQL